MTVRQSLLSAEFSTKHADDKARQMKVRRRVKKRNPSSDSTATTSPTTVDVASPAADVSTITEASVVLKFAPPKVKAIRRTTNGAQQNRANQKSVANHKKRAFKAATTLLASEKLKGAGGLSANGVIDKIQVDYGIKLARTTLSRYVREGDVGTSPKKPGNPGAISEWVFQSLCTAFSSFVKINQLNAREVENDRKNLKIRILRVMAKEQYVSGKLLDRILDETAIDLLSKVTENVEDRRVRWTTYTNLKSWFNNWEHDLEELGFGKRNEEGDLIIPEEQLSRILNIDESCLSMDGSKGRRGGRPTAVFYSPILPQSGRPTGKSGLTTTLITGSTAAGEAIPPHFQFSTRAKTTDKMKLRMEMVTFMPDILGRFGCTEERNWPISFGVNAKGGMDEEEFEKYLLNSIFPLYPDVKNEDGKRVLIKVDSGPGRLNVLLLASCRLLGFVLYPGVPNTTAVSQETDRNYGPFKTTFRQILDDVVQERINQGKSTSLPPWIVGLVVFGGVDPETMKNVERNAFEEGFNKASCLDAWAKVGAAPVTRACMEDKLVRRELGDADDELNVLMQKLNEANDLSCFLLTQQGYRGDLLAVQCVRKDVAPRITVPHTLERWELLSGSGSHGTRFHATGGSHCTTDDFFKSCEIPVWDAQIKVLEDKKDECARLVKIETEGKAVMDLGKAIGDLNAANLEALLHWYTLEPKAKMGLKPEKVRKWTKIVEDNTPPPVFDKWMDGDEAELQRWKKKDIKMGDTALGRLVATKKRQLDAAADHCNRSERDKLRAKLDLMDAFESAEDAPAADAPAILGDGQQEAI
jgi:hypothetical protein